MGCCGRIALLKHNEFIDIMQYELPHYIPQKISFNQSFIPIITSDIRKYKIPQQINEIDVWAIRLHDVMKKNGEFKTTDLKDYYSLKECDKLILSTSANDFLQEILWNHRLEIDFTDYNIDYWFPGHFSVYDNDSKFYQLSSLKRQQIHAFVSKSQFFWFRLSNTINIDFYSTISNIPSILISTGQMRGKQSENILINEIKVADTFFPPSTSFFFIGGYSKIPKLNRDRSIYIFSQKWAMLGNYGKDLHRNIRYEYKMDEREKLLINNLKEEMKNVKTKINSYDGRRSKCYS